MPLRDRRSLTTDRIQRKTMLTVIASGDNVLGVELRQLATFVAVAEEGSFTRASDRLHVVQSAVSAGVRKLEKATRDDAVRPLHPPRRADRRGARAAAGGARHAGRGRKRRATPSTKSAAACAERSCSARCRPRGCARSTSPACWPHSAPSTQECEVQHSSCRTAPARWHSEVREGRLDLAFVALPGDGPPGVQLIAAGARADRARRAGRAPTRHARRYRTLGAAASETLVDLPAGLGHPHGRRPLLHRRRRDPHHHLRAQRHRDHARLHPPRTRRRPAAHDRSSTPPTTSRSCRFAITHPSSRPRSRSRPTAGSPPPTRAMLDTINHHAGA